MSDETKLTPDSITITAELKHFSLDGGQSAGSVMGITFRVPDGMPRTDLLRQMLIEQEQMDLAVLVAQYMKGATSLDAYKAKMRLIKSNYDMLLKRKPPTDDTTRD